MLASDNNGGDSTEKTLVSDDINKENSLSDKMQSSKDGLNQSRLLKPTAASKARAQHSKPQPPKKTPQTSIKPIKTVPVRPVTAAPKSQRPSLLNVVETPLPMARKVKKACSSPIDEGDHIADLTHDASCIPGFKSNSNSLDETISAPNMRMTATRSNKSDLDSTILSRQTVSRASTRGVGGNRIGGVIGSRGAGSGGTTQEGVTEEMLEIAYTRYIQACFIAMRSREAKDKVKKEIDNQIFTAFSATEKLRQEVAKVKEEKELWDCLAKVGKSLKLVKEKLSPALDLMAATNDKLGRVVEGLDKVQHHLIVQGINLPDQQTAATELDTLSKMFVNFNQQFESVKEELGRRSPQVECLAAEYEQVASHYSYCLTLVKRARVLMNQVDSLATQEASLAISLDMLKKEEEKQELVDI